MQLIEYQKVRHSTERATHITVKSDIVTKRVTSELGLNTTLIPVVGSLAPYFDLGTNTLLTYIYVCDSLASHG